MQAEEEKLQEALAIKSEAEADGDAELLEMCAETEADLQVCALSGVLCSMQTFPGPHRTYPACCESQMPVFFKIAVQVAMFTATGAYNSAEDSTARCATLLAVQANIHTLRGQVQTLNKGLLRERLRKLNSTSSSGSFSSLDPLGASWISVAHQLAFFSTNISLTAIVHIVASRSLPAVAPLASVSSVPAAVDPAIPGDQPTVEAPPAISAPGVTTTPSPTFPELSQPALAQSEPAADPPVTATTAEASGVEAPAELAEEQPAAEEAAAASAVPAVPEPDTYKGSGGDDLQPTVLDTEPDLPAPASMHLESNLMPEGGGEEPAAARQEEVQGPTPSEDQQSAGDESIAAIPESSPEPAPEAATAAGDEAVEAKVQWLFTRKSLALSLVLKSVDPDEYDVSKRFFFPYHFPRF